MDGRGEPSGAAAGVLRGVDGRHVATEAVPGDELRRLGQLDAALARQRRIGAQGNRIAVSRRAYSTSETRVVSPRRSMRPPRDGTPRAAAP